MIRIGLVDDHRLFRKSLASLIKVFKKIDVVLEADNGLDFLTLIETIPIDVVLMDIQMPLLNGYQTCKILTKKYPSIKILIVSQFTTEDSIKKVFELGADGYFSKKSDPELLEEAINNVYNIGHYFGVDLHYVIKQSLNFNIKLPSQFKKEAVTFSEREIHILELASKELNSGEISGILFITIRTVETHRKRIMEKAGCKNFIGAILFAVKNGFISLDG